ncbi:MAG: hypothetical protein K0S44_2787 [Bacteroidetes bacterium]|jgi:hypothetical protein|nr:hypothetical protein [Bacteroidota bacterium]
MAILKKIKIRVLLLPFFCIISSLCFSQNLTKEQAEKEIALCNAVAGTYKIIQADPRHEVAIKTDICQIVKDKRKAAETVYYKYNEEFTIEIYSEEQIKKLNIPEIK